MSDSFWAFIAIFLGIALYSYPKFYTELIKKSNEAIGVKTKITPNTVRAGKYFGLAMIVGGVIIVISKLI